MAAALPAPAMRPSPIPLLLFAALLALSFQPVPQDGGEDPPPAEPSVADLLRAARDPRHSLEERLATMESLLPRGPDATWPLAQQIEREAARLARDYESGEPRFLRAFERDAQRLSVSRQSREALREIDERRAEILTGARDGGLTKEHILEVSGPALARLEELLWIEPNHVFDLEPLRFDEFAILLDNLLERRRLLDLWRRAREHLLLSGATSRARSLRQPDDPAGQEDALHLTVEFTAILAVPMGSRDSEVLRTNRALGRDPSLGLQAEELAGIERLNAIRILCGIPALALDARLCDASRDHSKDMVELGFFSHTSPVKGKETPGQRAANFGTSGGAENIAAGQSNGPDAIGAWWTSPGHHRNMLGGHGRVGLGRWEQTWTQMFG